MPFPLSLETLVSKPMMFLIFGLIGFAFGFVLESAGFGNSKKLAAQFYFKDMTVLKVMFGAIITAMVLLFITIGLGILDFSLVWVNPTYLASGIVGGLIMGVGFIIGGFCPGTSLVAMATRKIDGLFFVFGVLFGIFAFGETVEYFYDWWNNAGYMGRVTIP
ncbi:MAG: YeeE/YedE family protein, partial [Anaerolineae bacterium]|nr:YeeE/YedE family protein [Anaerolineae bacterium]